MEGGRTRLFCLAMQRPARPPAENSRGRPLRDGDRDERRPSVTPDPSRSAWVRPIFKREGARDHGARSSATFTLGTRAAPSLSISSPAHGIGAPQSRRHLCRRPGCVTSTRNALNEAIEMASATDEALGHANDPPIHRPTSRARPGKEADFLPGEQERSRATVSPGGSVPRRALAAHPCRAQLARRQASGLPFEELAP